MSYWIAVKTKPLRERYAAENVDRQGYTPYVPFIEKRRGRKLAFVTAEPLFRSYMFVETDGSWRFLLGTYGVTSVVMRGDSPAIMPERVLNAIRQRERNGIIELPRLKIGDRVRVTDGAFMHELGLYQGQTSTERAKVLMEILGGQRTITIANAAIEAA